MKKMFLLIGVLAVSFTLSACDLLPEDILEQTQEEICAEDPENEICDVENIDDLDKIINDEAVATGLSMFLNDFNDDTLTNEDFCGKWFEGIDNDCDGLGEERMKGDGNRLSVVSNVMDVSDLVDNMVTGSLKFNFDGHVTVLKFALTLTNTDGVLGYKITSSSMMVGELELSELRDEIMLFIDDYSNPELTNEEVCAMWFDGEDQNCDGLTKERTKFKAGADLSKKVNIMDNDDDGDMLEATVKFELDGHVTVLKIAFDASDTEGMIKLNIHEVSPLHNGMDENEFGSMVDQYLMDLFNPEITSTEFEDMWNTVRAKNDPDDEDIRVKLVAKRCSAPKPSTTTIVKETVEMLDVTASVSCDGHVTVLKISFVPDVEDGKMMMKVDKVEIIKEYEVPADLDALILKLAMDYINSDITDDVFIKTWVRGEDNDCDGLTSARAKFKAGKALADTVKIMEPDASGMYDAVISIDVDGEIVELHLTGLSYDSDTSILTTNVCHF